VVREENIINIKIILEHKLLYINVLNQYLLIVYMI